MAKNVIEVAAAPEDVYQVLLDPYAYPEWVVGTKGVRAADRDWPATGSSFHHTVLLAGRDRSEMLSKEPGRRVMLKVFARPLGVGIVDIELEPVAKGTRVTISERP